MVVSFEPHELCFIYDRSWADNDHTNEPSHHIPYLYAVAGDPSKTQLRVHEVASSNYNDTPNGLSGVRSFSALSCLYHFFSIYRTRIVAK